MGFLSPWFLGGLLAAGLPIYVHLLRQHRSDPMKFSSVMFIERRTQSSVKHRRLKYLALLAMRLASVDHQREGHLETVHLVPARLEPSGVRLAVSREIQHPHPAVPGAGRDRGH